jgi:hypothetical protein
MRRLHLLQRKLRPAVSGTLKVSYSSIFLKEQQIMNPAHHSKLLKERVKPAFRSKRRDRSVTSICLLHDNARQRTATVTTGTLEEMHWEVLPHPTCSPDLVPSDFYLFGSLKEALGEKSFTADDEIKLSVQMAGGANTNFTWRGYNKCSQAMLTVYWGAERICSNISISFWKKDWY